MTTLPDNLTEDELALLRLAGELPVGVGRAGVSTDAPDGSGALRDAFAALDGPLTLDAARQPLPSPAASVRAVVRAMQDMAAVEPAEVRRRRRLRVPGWVIYPTTAAAMVAIGMFAWWYQVHDQFAKAKDAPMIDPGPAVLLLQGEPDGDLASRSDEQIVRQFEPMIVLERPGGEAERQLAALKFLEEAVQ